MVWANGWGPPACGPRPVWQVEDSPDFQRIKALPLTSPEENERRGRELIPEMSELLRRPGSNALLKWPQALLLDWLYTYRGAYAGLPPGVGKTLPTFLAPVVLDSRQPVLVAPASLHKDKTSRDFARYSKDWTPHYKSPTLLNLEAMSLDQNLLLLDKLKPDLVMFDESDLGRNLESAAMVRLDRYRTAAPEAAFMLLTGSGMRFGIEDYDVHICWCLPNGHAPVPYNEEERGMWREALRARPKGRPNNAQRRPRAGVLLDLCALPHLPKDEQPRNELETAQAIVARRINCTPGVLIIDDDDCDVPITINLVRAPDDPIIDQDFERFYGTSVEGLEARYDGDEDGEQTPLAYCLPNGEPCTNGLEVWGAIRSLGCGFFSYPDPPPPIEYKIKRRRYARRIQSLISESMWSSNPADTPGAAKRRFPNDPAILEWEAVQRQPFPPLNKPFKANMVVQQQSDSVVRYAVEWMREHNSLVWCSSVPLARWIARAAGVRYYGAEGKAADGALLEDAQAGERAVVSIKANSRGRNLQDRFHTGLILQLPQSGDECHQLFKRYHRFGQQKPVRWDVLITSGAARYSFDMAKYEARLVKKQRRQTQTILRADIVDCILPLDIPRWFRKPAPT